DGSRGEGLRWRPYAIAIGAVLVAALVRELLTPFVGPRIYWTFNIALVVAAWLGGLWPGLLATVLGAVLAISLFLNPEDHSLAIVTVDDAVGLFIYLFIGVVVSVLSETMHR